MGISRSFIAGIVKTAFGTLGDIPVECTYHSCTSGSNPDYDLSTGVAIFDGDDYTLTQVISAKFKEDEVDRDIAMMTDKKFLFPRIDLPVVPKASDVVEDGAGQTWEVRRVLSDPADALCILHVRSS